MKTNYISKSSRTHEQVRRGLQTFITDVSSVFEYGYVLTEDENWFIIATHDDMVTCDVLCYLPKYLRDRVCVALSPRFEKIELLFAKNDFSK